jgi:hypothetical protein
MEIIIGILVLAVIVQEVRIQKLVNRLLFQASIPEYLGPVRTTAPIVESPDKETPAPIDTRKKLFSLKMME